MIFATETRNFTNRVILSAARTTRSEVLTESKDPYIIAAAKECTRFFASLRMAKVRI